MLKLSNGLLSGRYSVPAVAPNPVPSSTVALSESPFTPSKDTEPRFQQGIRPAMFKDLVGKGHAEFATMRQQDSEEFLQHFIDRLRQEAKRKGSPSESEATETFRFALEQKLTCSECKGVSYKTDSADSLSLTVPIKERDVVMNGGEEGAAGVTKSYESAELTKCLDSLVAEEALEYSCPNCQKKVIAVK